MRDRLVLPEAVLTTPLSQWRMEHDDLIIRYLFRQCRPQRHLEFGTWEGIGVLRCLEECGATVWTINVPEGEVMPDGRWAYATTFDGAEALPAWRTAQMGRGKVTCQTDALGFIGRRYIEAKMGHRVCQIYCDSRDWDITHYPRGFFDTAMIDGGHAAELVVSDTHKAFELVRPGGLILWHDYCADPETQAQCSSTRGVVAAILTERAWIAERVSDLFWIEPSWILLGVKR